MSSNRSSESIASAVSFAASMVRQGEYIGKAINVAANYYKVDRSEVQRGLAARSGRSQKGRKRAAKPERICDNCSQQPAVWHATIYYGFNQDHFYSCADCGQIARVSHERPDKVVWTSYRPTEQAT